MHALDKATKLRELQQMVDRVIVPSWMIDPYADMSADEAVQAFCNGDGKELLQVFDIRGNRAVLRAKYFYRYNSLTGSLEHQSPFCNYYVRGGETARLIQAMFFVAGIPIMFISVSASAVAFSWWPFLIGLAVALVWSLCFKATIDKRESIKSAQRFFGVDKESLAIVDEVWPYGTRRFVVK